MTFAVDNLGAETYHGRPFCHELPNGFPFWVVLHMMTPHYINLGDQMVITRPGSCVIYPPNYPRYLYCPPEQESVCNNWIHFSVSDDAAFRQLLSELELPVNQLFMERTATPLIATLQDITYEHSTDQRYNDRMVTALVQILLLQLGRGKLQTDEEIDYKTLQHLNNFERLRKEMYNAPEKPWTVASMAARVYLGQNQFITLYRTFFRVTPRQDLIHARIAKAQSLLSKSSILRDVALTCGFKNEFYFSTVFKKVVGVTPGQYAKSGSSSPAAGGDRRPQG